MSADIHLFDPERFRLKPDSPLVAGNSPKPTHSVFARTWLPCLTDRAWDYLFPPLTRLWLFLLIKSKEGRRPVRLSNELAKEIGLDRHAKSRALERLERGGLVSAVRSEGQAPIVTVIPAGRCLNRAGVLSEPRRGVVSSEHLSDESIYTSLSTASSIVESYKDPLATVASDALREALAALNTPCQPVTPRLPIPPETRDAVNDRAGGACEQCGCDAPLELHHLHYSTQGQERPQDLQALCRECHESRHRDALGMFWADPVEMRQIWG